MQKHKIEQNTHMPRWWHFELQTRKNLSTQHCTIRNTSFDERIQCKE